MIVPIRLSISNAFLLKGERPVLIDTGCPNDHATLLNALAREGVAVRDLSLILHTHGHRDHAGGTWELKQVTPAPTAIHPADADMLRQGANRALTPTRLTGYVIRPFVDRPFPKLEPDLLVGEETDLRPYGVPGRILLTPGHTAGSIAIVLDSGEVLAGDLLIGGYLGGLFAPNRPGYPYFVEDMTTLNASIQQLMAQPVTRLYVGHGGPLEAQAVRKRFGREAGR